MVDTVKYNPDVIMRKCWFTLLSDFRATYGRDFFAEPAKLLNESVASFRDFVWPSRMDKGKYWFKTQYQLETFLKRYRFKEDKYTDTQLEDMAHEKELENIRRLSVPINVTPALSRVLVEARAICHSILGEFDVEEFLNGVEFGVRANVGTMYEDSYLDWKIYASPITGSMGHHDMFAKYLRGDSLLNEILQRAQRYHTVARERVCYSLKQTYVPKKFNSLRGITPDTILGTFFSKSLGKMMEKRLKRRGLNIAKLQVIHGKLACLFSVSRTHVTADLSAASQSITSPLVKFVMDDNWFQAMEKGRISLVTMRGVEYHTPTYAGMGIGFTFPLQTLIFYCLLEAIRVLSRSSGFVSVYGDDLIYPRRIHRYVSTLFPRLNLVINEDKTYVEEHFRESCGSDFYRGADVRPFSFEGGHCRNDKAGHLAFLNTLINGLRTRWDSAEIPQTIRFLEREIMAVGELYIVPPSFPVFSGVRCDNPGVVFPWYYHIGKRPVNKSLYFAGVKTSSRSWVFHCLQSEREYRPVFSVYPYYWDKLRSGPDEDQVVLPYKKEEDIPSLKWREIKCPTRRQKNKVKLVPHVRVKGLSHFRSQTGQIPIWI